jgi:hypothetical protein
MNLIVSKKIKILSMIIFPTLKIKPNMYKILLFKIITTFAIITLQTIFNIINSIKIYIKLAITRIISIIKIKIALMKFKIITKIH